MPDLGLYQAKYGLRRVLDRIPGIARLDPNAVSLSALAASAVAAWAFATSLWPLLAIGIVLRMVLSTLDGHIAENYGKKTRVGGYINRLVSELADVAILVGFVFHARPGWALAVICGAWTVNILGLVGLVAGGKIQSVGPAGQTDRMALLLVVAIIASFVDVDWTLVAQIFVALIAVTIVLRLDRSVRELRTA